MVLLNRLCSVMLLYFLLSIKYFLSAQYIHILIFSLVLIFNKTKSLVYFKISFCILCSLELHKHWEAEDELLDMQNVMDETEIKLQDARAEITRLNKKLNQVCLIYSNFYFFL